MNILEIQSNPNRFKECSIKPNKLHHSTLSTIYRFIHDNKHLHYLIIEELNNIEWNMPTFYTKKDLKGWSKKHRKKLQQDNRIIVEYGLVSRSNTWKSTYYHTNINISKLLVLLNDGIIEMYTDATTIINNILSLENQFKPLDPNQTRLFN